MSDSQASSPAKEPRSSVTGPRLPPGPWRVVPGYVGRRRALAAFLVLLGVVSVVVATFHGVTQWRDMARQRAIFDHPDAVEVSAEFSGRLRNLLDLTTECRGRLTFVGTDGRERTRGIAFDVLGGLARDVPLRVRHLPAEPDDFAVNWAVMAEGRRRGHLWFVLALGLLVYPGAMVLLARPFWRRAAIAAAVQIDGREALGRFVRSRETKKMGRVVKRSYEIAWHGPQGDCTVTGEFSARQGGPCFVDDEHVLLVWSPSVPGSALVLRHDLWPLQLPAEQVRAAAGTGSGRG